MQKMDIGMIGMAVMGSNLALNMADHGFNVACYNYTPDLTEKVLKDHPHDHMHGFFTLEDFVNSLAKPRRIMMMIMAGAPVDSVIEKLIPLLDEGDMVMDGGNSFFEDTIRRHKLMAEAGINYFGVGISGGEKGARLGPCIMPGGDAEAYKYIQPIYEAIAAKTADGEPCCTYIGNDGAGHYVKMVHNGIEYADMQLITEAYLLLKHIGGYDNEKIAEIFNDWNQGELKSFLVGITADIFAEKDENGVSLVDVIVDQAGQKGTGRWTSIQAMKQGVNISMITAACNARVMSNLIAERSEAGKRINQPAIKVADDAEFIEAVRKSLYAAKIVAYAQGFALYRSAADEFGWKLDFGAIAKIFRAGCIIQAEFLNKISDAYEKNPELSNLVLDDFFMEKINSNIDSLRSVMRQAISAGIPAPVFANAIEYLDALRSGQLGANLIQGQRDYFGAHTFKRIDMEGTFHHEWQEHFNK